MKTQNSIRQRLPLNIKSSLTFLLNRIHRLLTGIFLFLAIESLDKYWHVCYNKIVVFQHPTSIVNKSCYYAVLPLIVMVELLNTL